MPRPRPPYLSHERNRHGTSVWYVRVSGKRIRIRETYGTPEFDAAYQAALAGKATVKKAAPDVAAGTLKWLIDQYRDTAAWQHELSEATRRQRDNVYKQVIAASGNVRYTLITRADIERGRERRAATPHQARHFLDAMRALFRWAHKQGISKTIPRLASKILHGQRMRVLSRGMKMTFSLTSRGGRLAPDNVFGLTCCSTPV